MDSSGLAVAVPHLLNISPESELYGNSNLYFEYLPPGSDPTRLQEVHTFYLEHGDTGDAEPNGKPSNNNGHHFKQSLVAVNEWTGRQEREYAGDTHEHWLVWRRRSNNEVALAVRILPPRPISKTYADEQVDVEAVFEEGRENGGNSGGLENGLVIEISRFCVAPDLREDARAFASIVSSGVPAVATALQHEIDRVVEDAGTSPVLLIGTKRNGVKAIFNRTLRELGRMGLSYERIELPISIRNWRAKSGYKPSVEESSEQHDWRLIIARTSVDPQALEIPHTTVSSIPARIMAAAE